MEDFQEQFDEQNPPITIPAEVKMDVDADYDLDFKGQDDKEDAEWEMRVGKMHTNEHWRKKFERL